MSIWAFREEGGFNISKLERGIYETKEVLKGELILNKVILIGRLTKDPELSYLPTTGKAAVRFTLAVPRPFNREETDFISCKAFGKTAEIIATYVTKGRQVAISGSIRTGSYDGKDGNKKYTTEVWLDSFEFIGNNSSGNATGQDDNFYEDMTPVEDNDMPF